jgi:hypothetical protein
MNQEARGGGVQSGRIEIVDGRRIQGFVDGVYGRS